MSTGGAESPRAQETSSKPWTYPYLIGSPSPGNYGTSIYQTGQGIQGAYDTGYNEVFQRPQTFFSGQTYANFDPLQTQAQDLTVQRALNGNLAMNAGNESLTSTLNGDYLNGGNPGFQNMVGAAIRPMEQQFTDVTMPALDSQFAAGGRYGGASQILAKQRAADNYLRDVGDVTSRLSYQNYGDERNRQMQAASMAPAYAQQDYANLAALEGVGQQRQAMDQASINEAMARHEFEQNEAFNRVNQWLQILNGGGPGQVQITTGGGTGAPSTNPYMGAAGGALSGAAAGAAFGGWGAIPGAIIGGGLGYMGSR